MGGRRICLAETKRQKQKIKKVLQQKIVQTVALQKTVVLKLPKMQNRHLAHLAKLVLTEQCLNNLLTKNGL